MIALVLTSLLMTLQPGSSSSAPAESGGAPWQPGEGGRPDAPGHTEPESPIEPSAGEEMALAARLNEPDPQSALHWAQGLVWYQIFPERFRNGNPKNDPQDPLTYLKAWSSDWYGVDEAEKAAWEKRQENPGSRRRRVPAGGEIYQWMFDRRYGGDLQGVVEKLDELKDLGVTALYLNPVFQAASMHKYDAADHRHVDENLGWPAEAGEPRAVWQPNLDETLDPKTWQWTPADRYLVDVLLPEARKRGMRVILDGVWNHVGRNHFAFQDVMRNGKLSAYADWFVIEWDDSGMRVKGWKAWDGKNGWLPSLRQTAEGDLAPGPKEHVFAVTMRWMDPNGDGDPSDGIDGWRLDVVPDMPATWWKGWSELVKSINPGAITIAEIWHDKDGMPQGKYFDTQMNYPFAFCVLDWLNGRDGKGQTVGSTELVKRLEASFGTKNWESRLIAQNLFDSHDTDRFVQMLYNPGREYDRDNSAMNKSKGYKTGRPSEEAFKLSVLGVAIQATYPGSPMVYYGNEYGMWGEDDPDDRKPTAWPDLEPNDNPDDWADLAMREQYKKWLTLRADPGMGEALKYGKVKHLDSGNADVFAFEREYKGVKVLVVVNRGKGEFDAKGLGGGVVKGVGAGVWVVK